jgi:hypothetical protein
VVEGVRAALAGDAELLRLAKCLIKYGDEPKKGADRSERLGIRWTPKPNGTARRCFDKRWVRL